MARKNARMYKRTDPDEVRAQEEEFSPPATKAPRGKAAKAAPAPEVPAKAEAPKDKLARVRFLYSQLDQAIAAFQGAQAGVRGLPNGQVLEGFFLTLIDEVEDSRKRDEARKERGKERRAERRVARQAAKAAAKQRLNALAGEMPAEEDEEAEVEEVDEVEALDTDTEDDGEWEEDAPEDDEEWDEDEEDEEEAPPAPAPSRRKRS